ncbi:hypothetical protein [Paenibacillus allorhizoplanae]|nr:hypothetical protein [Paenibacillus allorhizoplanae]
MQKIPYADYRSTGHRSCLFVISMHAVICSAELHLNGTHQFAD